MALAEALASLAGGFGAEAAVLSRHARGEPRPRAIATHDAQASDPNAAMLRRALCGDVLGFYYPKALASTIWFLTDHLEDANWQSTGTLENWRTARGIREIVIVVIAASLQQRDYLEFHFTRELAYSEKLELETLMPTLVRAWSGRKTGLVTQVPRASEAAPVSAAPAPAELDLDLGDGVRGTLVLTPGGVGTNSAQLTVVDAGGAPVVALEPPQVSVGIEEFELGPFRHELVEVAPGSYEGSIDLPIAGTWRIDVGVRISTYERPSDSAVLEVTE